MGTRLLQTMLVIVCPAAVAGCSSDDSGRNAPPAAITATATAPPTPTATTRASAHRITSETELLTGPLAHGRIGDYLLENEVARFVIQDAAKRDLYSVGQFGGNIIDAELRSRPGLDNLLEVQPAVNIETVLNAQTIEIVNDGADGEAAILRACGPDDILDFVSPSTVVEGAGSALPRLRR